MVAINPKTLKVISQITLPEMIGGRVTTAVYNNHDYIYLPGTSKLYRYVFANGKLQADPTWGPVPYLKSGQTAGSAVAVMGNYVVTMTNGGSPTSTPMSAVAVSQADSNKVANLQPFASSGSKNSFIPSMVSVDPASHLIYVMDAGAGKIGAVSPQQRNARDQVDPRSDHAQLHHPDRAPRPPDPDRHEHPDQVLQAAEELLDRASHLARRRHRQTTRRLRPIPQDVRRHPRHPRLRRPAVLPHSQRPHHRAPSQPQQLDVTAPTRNRSRAASVLVAAL